MPAFHLHRSNRLERLVASLGDLLAEPIGGPLCPEAVVVQGRGMAIWLGGELAKRFGVWAAPMRYPRELVEQIVGAVLGKGALGDPPSRKTCSHGAFRPCCPSCWRRRSLLR